MKVSKIITRAFLLSLFSINAFAQENSTTRDIWFLPKQGQFLLGVDAKYEATVTNVEFTGTPKLHRRSTKGGPSLAYAFTDEFILGVGISLESKKEDSLLTPTTKESNTASGANDPAIAALYRILKQEESGAFLDITLGASPSLGKSKNKNVLRGSHKFATGLRAGQQKDKLEYALGITLGYNTEEKYDSGNTYKPRFDLGLSAGFQYDFNSLVSANAELGLELLGDLKVKSGTGSEQELNHAIKLAAGPMFQITENLSAGASLSYSKTEGEITNGPDFDVTSYALETQINLVF